MDMPQEVITTGSTAHSVTCCLGSEGPLELLFRMIAPSQSFEKGVRAKMFKY